MFVNRSKSPATTHFVIQDILVNKALHECTTLYIKQVLTKAQGF
jgi:hypothetical protein